jgi:hypothetical protein
VTVTCRQSGRAERALVVVAAPVPKVDVVEQGFSIRTSQTCSSASYNVVLANRSKTEDATEVSVLVNLVNASNALIGSQTTTIQTVHAHTQSVIGGSLTLPTGAALNHLGVVVHVGGSQPRFPSPVPVVANDPHRARRQRHGLDRLDPGRTRERVVEARAEQRLDLRRGVRLQRQRRRRRDGVRVGPSRPARACSCSSAR